MAASQLNITPNTPMGANLIAGGATFRTWAPHASEVYIAIGYPAGTAAAAFPKNANDLLVKDPAGYWAGFVPGVADGALYRFYVVGAGTQGFKRDPYARELEFVGYPHCNCIVRNPAKYHWHDEGFSPPKFHQLSIYQFHFGVFYARDAAGNDIRNGRRAKFLDAIDRIEYWVDLGVNAVMPLPFHEFSTPTSKGYNGLDIFSPEMDYAVQNAAELAAYLPRINRLLATKGKSALKAEDITGQDKQLKVFIDLCHLYRIAVIADVVYNHAGGGWSWSDASIWYYDFQTQNFDVNSLFFTPKQESGGLVFDYNQPEVRNYLINNGKSMYEEYHIDGLRYDQVTIIAQSGGWFFAQDLTNTLRTAKREAVQIAEYWDVPGDRWKSIAEPPFGMGFDLGYGDAVRKAVRNALYSAATGAGAYVNLDELQAALYMTYSDQARWKVFQSIENHDLEDNDHTGDDKQPRIAAISGREHSREPLPRKRSKVAIGLLLTAPGVPMIFMGQEFLEDKYWSDSDPGLLIYWDGLDGPAVAQQKEMSDQHQFTRDMLWLRRKQPALTGEGINVFHVHNDNRVIAFHRWIPGSGRDVVVVASLNENTFYDHSYRIGFPGDGKWLEVFNSDVYDKWVNPNVQGNGGSVITDGPPWNNMPTSANITLPANSILVFARDWGDF